MADEAMFKISIKGTGLTFDQSVDINAANKIMSFVMTGSALPGNAGGGNPGGGNPGGSGGSGGGAGSSGMDAKQFLAQKKPNTLYERIACLGYFLNSEKNTSEFGSKELKAMNREAAQQAITNLPQRIRDTTAKYGFISAATGGKKQMTVSGDAVVLALPNRDAVKAAMIEYPVGKKRKKTSVKKKKKAA